MTNPRAGERVRSLRHLLGLSQSDLATSTNTRQSAISEIEKGTVTPSEAFLLAVGRATGTPPSFFEFNSADLPTGSLRHRKRSSARRLKRVQVLYEEIYRVADHLYDATGYRMPDLPMATSVDLAGSDIEAFASATREALDLSPDKPVAHVTRTLERGGIAVAALAIPDASNTDSEADLNAGHQGLTAWPGEGRPIVIGAFAGLAGDRQRFTLAHELGHLVLHARRRSIDERQAEDEAHRFAGAFLVPEDRAREILAGPLTLRNYALLKAQWGVAIQALVMRAHHLGLITDDRKQSLFRQISVRGWRTSEPVFVAPEQPVLLSQLLDRAYGSGTSRQIIAEQIGLPPLVLRGLIPAPGAGSDDDSTGVVRNLGTAPSLAREQRAR